MIDNILILSGGSSNRLSPLTHKNLFVFNGKALIEHQIALYTQFSKNVVVVVHEETVQSVRLIAQKYGAHVIEQSGEGMSGAVLSARKQLSGPTLIVNGNDMFHESMVEELIEKSHKSDIDGMFVVVKVRDYIPGGYIDLDPDGYVKGIQEKPDPDNMPSQYFKLVADYIKDIDGFMSVIDTTTSDRDDVYEVAMTGYISLGKKFAYNVYRQDWATIKYPWHVLDAMTYFLKREESYVGEDVSIDPTAQIVGNVYIENGAKIYEYAKIVGPCYIGKNVIVGNYALILQSMIGEKSVIGGYSEITRSYIGDNVWTHRAYIGDSVIEGDSNFGAGAVTANYRFDKNEVHVRVKGEKISTRRTKMGLIAARGVQLGVNATTMPGVKLSSGHLVMPGTVCSKDQ